MRLVALTILVPGRCLQLSKPCRVMKALSFAYERCASWHLSFWYLGEPLIRQPCRVMKFWSLAYKRCASWHWSFWYLGEPLTWQQCWIPGGMRVSDYIKTGVMAMHAGPGVSTSDDAGEVCSNSSTSDDAREVCSYRPVERKSSLAHIFNFFDHTRETWRTIQRT